MMEPLNRSTAQCRRLLAYGVLGSVLMLMNGHAINHPEIAVSKVRAVLLIVLFASAGALSFSFTKHK
jgi:hypothetical protein